MGKKKRNKIIREIAEQLPKFQTTAFRKELVNGSDILAPGQLKGIVNGIEILAGRTYVNDQIVKQDVNHYNRMKNMANKEGMVGIKKYILAVKTMQAKQDKK